MKVLHVIPTLDHRSGGPARALTGLARATRKAGAEVRVMLRDLNPLDVEMLQRVQDGGVHVFADRVRGADARRVSPPGGLGGLVDWADVVHIHAIWEGILHRAAVACRRRGVPYVFRPCGMLDPWCLAQKRLKKRAYIELRLRRDLNGAAAIHFTTARERDLVLPLRFKAPAIVEPNGLDLDEFGTLPAPGTFRRGRPAIGDRPILAFLGRVHHKKGLDLLVPAFAKSGADDWMMVIAGPDESGERSRIRAIAQERGIADRVLFASMLRGNDRLALLRDADLFALTSRQENFGIAVVEALAAGTPVVISDQVNISDEIAEAGVGGVTTLDVDAIAAELSAWTSDPARRAAAGVRARAFALDRYDWSHIAQRWIERYASMAGTNALGRSA